MKNSKSCSELASCYDLRSATSLNAALAQLTAYRKLWSACLLQSVGLNPPQGLIVTRNDGTACAAICNFTKDLGRSQFLLRHDTFCETPSSPRGGFIVAGAQLGRVLKWFLDHNRIIAVYEPLPPSRNGYNISVLLYSDTEAIAEVVGPGFDASDLQRGDLSPHESFAIQLNARPDLNEIGVQLTQKVRDREYQASVADRRRKLKRKAAEIKAQFGLSTGDDECGFVPLHYKPIDRSIVGQTVANIVASKITFKFRSRMAVDYPFTIASSFVEGGRRQVYWDVTSPVLKYEGAFGAAYSIRKQPHE